MQEPNNLSPLARILVVDDNPRSVRQLSVLLAHLAELTVIQQGDCAVRYASEHPVDLVLLSVVVPELGGYAACQALKANPETTDIPIVFITAQADALSEAHALTLGAADFIHEPINPPVLQARVKTQLALKQKTDALRQLSNLDALTGIANRRAFDETLIREWRRALRTKEPLSLLMLDVDHFKHYNDVYGHPVGDTCLRQVAQTLVQSAQRASDLVARYGGEEFAVILPVMGMAGAASFANHLCEQLRSLAIPHQNSPLIPMVTLSIGAATLIPACAEQSALREPCPDCPGNQACNGGPCTLVELADRALYQAKHAGRNRVVCLAEPFGQGRATDGAPLSFSQAN